MSTEAPALAMTIVANPAQATHKVCKLNDAKRGKSKWEPMFFVVCEPADAAVEIVSAELVKRQRITQRDLLRNRVQVAAI